jgi:hypothetical protein
MDLYEVSNFIYTSSKVIPIVMAINSMRFCVISKIF